MTDEMINSGYLLWERRSGLEEAGVIVDHLTKVVDSWGSPITGASPYELQNIKDMKAALATALTHADIGSYNSPAHERITALLAELGCQISRLERHREHLPNEEAWLAHRAARIAIWNLEHAMHEVRFGSTLAPPAYTQTVEEAEHVDHEADVALSASLLVVLSALLLPTSHRARWAEEACNELHDLAQAKATRGMQIYHALRYASRVFQLRNALKNPLRPRRSLTLRLVHWALASDFRTWFVIASVTTAALLNVVEEQGWGSALLAVPTAWVFYRGARWLRQRLGISLEKANNK